MSRGQKNPKVNFFFTKEKRWRGEFEKLRALVLRCPVTEELKWGKPCYAAEGANIVIMQGFKEYCALLFVKGVLLKDPRRILIQQTENVQAARQARFTSAEQIADLEEDLVAYVNEAIAVEKSGVEIKYKETSEFKMPDELKRTLAKDSKYKAAFQALTPGRQRGYLLHFGAAKQSETRQARIEKHRAAILQGRGLNE